MEYSEKALVKIVQSNLSVYHEIEAREVVFRRKFDSEQRRQTAPWTMLGRKAFQQEDFEIWVKLHKKEITDSQAIEMMTDLMERYYGQKYPLDDDKQKLIIRPVGIDVPELGKRKNDAEQLFYPITSKESPREILASDFKSLRGGLPIRGGWGYTKADACVIDKNDPLVDQALPFDGVGVEHVFVEKRIYEEMIIFRPDGEKFSGIRWNLQEQSLLQEAGRSFDRLIFQITAFRDSDWEELKAEFEGPQGHGTPRFNAEAHDKKRQEKMIQFTREFWFDITSFHGQGVVVTDKSTGKKELLPPESFKFTDKLKKLFGID